jgi:hypothetical protein
MAPRDILIAGRVSAPGAATPFMAALKRGIPTGVTRQQ